MILDLIKYIFLGAIQGFTEPIPVSSSGHLMIFKKLINSDVFNDLNFEILVNFGSLIAIVIFYWKDIKELVIDFFMYIKTKKKKYYDNFKYCWLIVIGTIPAGIVGLLFKDQIEGLLVSIKIIGAALLITSGCLYLVRNIKGDKDDKKITFIDALVIGLFQVVALFPGISRSGSTLVGGMFRNLKRESAFKYSFMLYIPISLATMVLGMGDLISMNLSATYWLYYICGMVTASVVTFFSIRWFSNIMKTGKLIYFVYYCFIAGTLILLFL